MKIQYRTMYKMIMGFLAAAAVLLIGGYMILRPSPG